MPNTDRLNLKVNYDSIYSDKYWNQFKTQIKPNDWDKIQSSLIVFKEFNIVDSIVYPKTIKNKSERIWFSKDFYIKKNYNSLKEFAQEFNDNFRLPIINNNIKNDIINLRYSDKHELEKYISLVLLKVYKSHLICCSQGYDIGSGYHDQDSLFRPLQYEFYKFSEYKRHEGLHSGVIYEWVQKNNSLLADSLIQNEINEIDKIKNYH